MKNKIILSLAIGLCLFGIGCSNVQAGNFFFKRDPVQISPATTNFVPIVVTNTITQTNWVTNTVTGAVAPELHFTTQISTNLQPVVLPAFFYTNLALGAAAETGVRTVGSMAGAAGVPFAPVAAAGLLAITNLIFGFLNNRNKRRAAAEAQGRKASESKLETAQLVGETLVENFEQLRKTALMVPGYTRDIDDKVMTLVQAAQAAAGKEVKSSIHNLVEEKTGFTIPG